ncbi:MAG: MFS transporter [Deltaproteobacteria bacterium]|nr:MFS transporter [Deltaproteobacteria bacterium]
MLLENTFRAFRHRDYFIFWWGLFLGHTGTLIQATAQGWLILQLTDSPFYLGLDGLCIGLPRVIFSPLGGALVDRMNKRFLFVVTQAAFLVMALFLGLMNFSGLINVWHVLAVSALTGFFLSFEQPIRQTILHEIVPPADLLNAISLYQLVFNGSVLFGPAVGGALIPVIGTTGCFFLHAIGNFIVLVTLFMIRIPETAATGKKKSLTRDVVEGFTIAWHNPIFFSLFAILAVASFCTKPYNQFMPVFARDILQVGAPGLGLLLMAPGAGAIFGALTLASLTRFPKAHHLLLLLAGGFGFFVTLFAASRSFPLSLFFLFLAGAFQTTLLSAITTLLQIHSSEKTRGRVMSLYGLVNRGLGPMGAFPIGAIATWLGAPLTISLGGLLAIAMTAYLTLSRPHLREATLIGLSASRKKERGA